MSVAASIDMNNEIVRAVAQFYGLDPKLLDPEVITLMGIWSSTPGSIVQPKGFVYEPGYTHFIWGVGGFIQIGHEGQADADWARLEFNITPGLANVKPLFVKPLNFAAFTSTQGGANCITTLPGFKVLPDKTQLNARLTANPLDPTWTGADASVGVVVYGVRLRQEPQE